jgi:glucose-1-phosphate thymidylyltransferase
VIIGKNCEIGAGTYIGPYTSIGDNVIIEGGEIENTIVMEKSIIRCGKRIVDSLIGTNSKIVSADTNLPRGYKLMVGENAFMSL